MISGGVALSGEVRIAGAKNAVLKQMAAAVLTDEPVVLRNVPRISDVAILREVMGDIGFDVDGSNGEGNGHTVRIRATEAPWPFIPLDAARKMRASFILLGPMLARFGRVILPNPGGDKIGRRPVDFHVAAMEALGATVVYRNGYYYASADGLRGARIGFPDVTVMGTENAILAAALARGTTVIENAAMEPEVDDLITMLCSMGARIERTAPRTVEIDGVERLGGTDHTVIGDRLEAETFAIAAATTGGDVELHGVVPAHLGSFLEVAERAGVQHEADADRVRIIGSRSRPLRAVDVETAPYPGFATDFQAPLSVLLTQAEGTSTIHETIFEDRLDHLRELRRMGASIEIIDDRRARITGPTPLRGAEVGIADLRAGATLILAGLVARGTTVVSGVEHVDRGYEQIEAKLVGLGARISRIEA